mgnify:CR=1 FL=1
MPSTIWLTGASGFTAGHLRDHLREAEPEARLVGLARGVDNLKGFDAVHRVDMTDAEALAAAAAADPPGRVYHLAGAVPPASEEAMYFTNVAGTRLLIEAVASSESPPVRVLVVSSAAVYRPSADPVVETSPAGGANAYGRSKWSQEQVALTAGLEFGVDVRIARTFNLIGPGLPGRLLAGSVCARLQKDDVGTGPLEMGDLSAFRDFIDVRDAVAAYRTILENGQPGVTYNVCRGEGLRSRSLVRQLIDLSGTRRDLVERSTTQRPGVDRSVGDVSALRDLGWTPRISLKQSLRDMLEAAARQSKGLKV